MVLLHEEHFCEACFLRLTFIDKCGLEAAKTLPRPPKIEPAATPSSKKTTNMNQKSARSAQEPAKSEKRAPKSEKCANMGPNMKDFGLDSGAPGLP